MILEVVAQKAQVHIIFSGSAAGSTNFVPETPLFEACPNHVLHGHVVILPGGGAFTSTVVHLNCLPALIAETQLTHFQVQCLQRALFRPVGSFSPSGLLLANRLAFRSLPVKQRLNHVLKLALCEALEHHGKL